MTGIRKFEKFCETIRVIEERKEVQIMNKIQLLYNRYSSKNSMQMEKLPVSLLGGIHRFENVSGRPLIDQIAKMDILRPVSYTHLYTGFRERNYGRNRICYRGRN